MAKENVSIQNVTRHSPFSEEISDDLLPFQSTLYIHLSLHWYFIRKGIHIQIYEVPSIFWQNKSCLDSNVVQCHCSNYYGFSCV